MCNGRITGHGRYTSSAGTVQEGYFVNGELQGEGRYEEKNGYYEEGVFVHGKLNGYGKQVSRHGEIYEGSFQDGTKYGRGVLVLSDKSTIIGFWLEDLPCGRGEYLYGNANKDTPITHECDFIYEGSFSEGKVKGRHRHVDVHKTHQGHVPFTTYAKNISHMREPTALAQKLSKANTRYYK